MKYLKRWLTVLALIAVLAGLFGASLTSVQARDAQIGLTTKVILRAKVVNNVWGPAGNLNCISATLQTVGGATSHNGVIKQGGAFLGFLGNSFCDITFDNVVTPLALTPTTVTVTYTTLAVDEILDLVTQDRKQTEQKDYILEWTWFDTVVIYPDMILKDTSTIPVIEVNPDDLPVSPGDLPTVPDVQVP